MSEIKTDIFKSFLQKQAEYYHRSGSIDCLKAMCESIEKMELQLSKTKLELIDLAKECGIEIDLPE